MGMRPFECITHSVWGSTLTSESDVYRRQILTSKIILALKGLILLQVGPAQYNVTTTLQ